MQLAARGHKVDFIAGDYGQPPVLTVGGVRAIRCYRPAYGNRRLRYPGDSWGVYRAMRLSKADIFLQRCVFHQTGRTWLLSKALGAKFVFSAGDERNAQHPDQLRDKHIWYRSTYVAAIRGADLVMCQNKEQLDAFRANYGVGAVIVPSIVDTDVYRPYAGDTHRGDALWVGRLAPRKRPHLFLDLAERLPERTFVMIGQTADDTDLARSVADRAASLANVRFVSGLPQHEMPEAYRGRRVLVSTSSSEGFPNVFLQAMSSAVPVISLCVDPEGILEVSGGGLSCNDSPEVLLSTIDELLKDERRLREMGTRARAYVVAHHAPQTVIPLYESMFADVQRAGRR